MRQRHKKRWRSAAASRLRRLAGNPTSVESAVSIVAGNLLRDISCPPTDLDAIMPRLNVTRYEPREDVVGSGALVRDAGGFKIIYFAKMSHVRKRWTLAHELAHAMFEGTGPNPPRRGRELERLCDMIAAEILLPRKQLSTRIQGDVCINDVLELATAFETSVTATAIRCAELRGVSVFETENGKLRWGYGAVRHDFDIASDSSLSHVVSSAAHSDAGSEQVSLVIGHRADWWIAEWRRIGGEHRRLFMLRLAHRVGRGRGPRPQREETTGELGGNVEMACLSSSGNHVSRW